GGVQDYKTTKLGLEQSGSAVDYVYLPRTIQDAIQVTSQLGYSFLWVDALCIVQDDAEEFNAEIAKMPDIYSGAVVTIAASAANSAADGFLQKRDAERNKNVYLIDRLCRAFQEHALSARILQYCHRQLRFLCEHRDGNCYTHRKDEWSHFDYFTFATDVYHPMTRSDWFSHFQFWKCAIESYCRRNLTYPRDRVLGISGIATRLQKFHGGDVYVAGHWISKQSQDLLWWAKGSRFDRGYGRVHGDPEWLAPSWAWTSVTRAVEF
ncbi:hypothetical protein BU23DRAFT_627281, partial [Bimuria novae-zelandiae CBS 107.79]